MSRMGPRAPRAGFTLIELLVVISIIGILAGLLLGAIVYMMGGAADTANGNDINQLKIALQKFKEAYGIYPPGIIRLCNSRALYDAPTGLANSDNMSLDAYSVNVLNKIWPKLGKFTNIRWDGTAGAATIDVTLYGDQCLVFFLGGIPQAGTRGLGFSTNPTDPSAASNDRKGPYFDFNPTRLSTTLRVASTNFPSYLDAYATNGKGNPILYFSASIRKLQNGYFDPLKVPATFNNTGFVGPVQQDLATKNYYITQAICGLTDPFGNVYTQSAMGAPYQGINPFQTANNGIFPFFSTSNNNASPFAATFVCPASDSFQIVTAGRDQVFGPGGKWQPSLAPQYDLPGQSATPNTPGQFDPNIGNGLDDMTSFHDRRMGATP